MRGASVAAAAWMFGLPPAAAAAAEIAAKRGRIGTIHGPEAPGADNIAE